MTKQLTISPCLNNFIYDILFNAPTEVKNNLPRKYRNAVKNSRTAQSFIGKCSHEEKLEILTLLEVQWYMCFFDRGFPQKRYLKDIFLKYKDAENNVQVMLNDLIKDRIYVTSDVEFARQIGIMSKIQNHHSYIQNMLLSKAGYHIKKWKKIVKDPKTLTAKENEVSVRYLMSTCMNFVRAMDMATSVFGVLENDINILLYLYGTTHHYVSADVVCSRFGEVLTRNAITTSFKRMYLNGLIRKSAKGIEYSISPMGVKKVSEIIEFVLKANEF